MTRLKTKKEVIVFGYPTRVKGITDLLEREGMGISPVQIGVFSGSQELLARLKLHGDSVDAIIMFGGPLKGALVPTVKQVREITSAPILVVLLEHHSNEDHLRKAGVTAVFQRDRNISADEVVWQLMEMLNNSAGVSAKLPVLRVPNVVQKPVKTRVYREKKPQPVKVRVPREKSVPKPLTPLQTFVILPKKGETAHEKPPPQAVPVYDEAFAIDGRVFNRRRRVILHGRRFYLSLQLCNLLRMLHSNKDKGVGMKECYQLALLSPSSAAVSVANLRKALVKANRRWGEAIRCIEGRYYLEIPPE